MAAIVNTVTATGTDASNQPLTATAGASVTVEKAAAALSLTKTGTLNLGGDGILNAGDTIAYVFAVKNTGNVTLTDVTVADPKVTVAGGPITSLAPDASDSTTFTATYTITQADIDAGKVDNTATASGQDPAKDTISAPASATVPLTPTPAIALIKTGTVDLGTDNTASVGDTITYHFTVTNTGNVTLSNVKVTDPLATVSGGPIAALAPGAVDSTTFTAVYTLKQSDIDAGKVTNQAQTTATAPDGKSVSDLSDNAANTGDNPTVITLAPVPKIALLKAVGTIADTNGDGKTDAGDTISYKLTVSNTGNVTLTNISVTDPKATVAGGPLATLAPGQSDATTFTASHVLTQADLDAGVAYQNQATVTASTPAGGTVTDLSDPTSPTGDAPTDTPLPLTKSIALLKKAVVTDTNNDGVNDAGDVITYSFEVTNTGNQTVNNITISDPLVTVHGGPLASLAPGVTDKTTFTATYTITAADMVAGQVVNQATASGTAADGTPVSDLSDPASLTGNDKTVVALTAKPAIALLKQESAIIDVNHNGMTDVGDQITYSFTVKNTGNIAVNNITVTDPLIPGWTGGPIATLAPGAIDTSLTATYTLTLADLIVGQVQNQATASGTSANGQPVTDKSDGTDFNGNAPTVTVLTKSPAIALVKQIASVEDVDHNGITDAGDIVHYRFTVTNTGNTPLSNITITDPLMPAWTGGPLASLAIGASDSSITATYTITQADVNAGKVTNQATAVGYAPDGTKVTDLSDPEVITGNNPTTLPISAVNSITLVKKASSVEDVNGDGITDAGDKIHYTFTVANTGNQTLTNIVISDPKVPVTGGPLASLAPGASDSTTFSAVYTVTYNDAQAGQVVNTATASGTEVNGTTQITAQSSDNTSNPPGTPTIVAVVKNKPGLTKTALIAKAKRGDPVPFDITATAVAFNPVRIVDIMPPGFLYGGSATVNGVAVTPTINGRYLTFTGLTPDANGNIKIRLTLIVGPNVPSGTDINNAEIYDNLAPTPIGRAKAAVEIDDLAVFDCGEVIGRVFDDKNHNGYPDDNEPGLPGVRIATVDGLLVTTDKQGRFHVACAALPDGEIGSNFVMKLDTRTLPTGYALTTENPRDVRLTAGKVSKLNFGAALQRLVRLTLKDAAFVPGQTTLKAQWSQGIGMLIKTLEVGPSTLRLIYLLGNEDKALAAQRLDAVQQLIQDAWSSHNESYRLSIDSQVIGTK